MPSDDEVLIGLMVTIGLFGVYEMIGVDPRFKHVHTISWYAKRHRWLRWAIAALFLAGGFGGFEWWQHHMHSLIYK